MDHPSPAEARDHADRQRFRWLDFLRGAEGRTAPAGKEHERLRAYVAQAGKILPPKGPIGAFVAQNPLQGLEDLPFDRAVREARRLLGGQGYLPNEAFRRIFAMGRITQDDLVRALETQVPHLANRPPIEVRERRVEVRDVCLTHLLHEIRPLPHGSLRWQVSHGRATRRFRQDLPPETRVDLLHRASRDLQIGLARLGEEWTLADWFRAHTNVDLGHRIRERAGAVLRTCAGSASRPFWQAFRASHATLTGRIAPTPGEHRDRCLNHLGIPDASREDYRKCVEWHAGPLLEIGGVATVTPEEAAALWLHYERQLLRDLAPRHLGTQGTVPAIRRHFERDPEAYAVSSLWAAVLATLELEDPVSVEDQEAGAAEALLQRVLATARDGMPRRDKRGDLVQRAHEALERDIKRIGPEWTLGDFCQHVTGARVMGAINDQMIRWCAAFLDEGLAGWPMPSRERGFYAAWRELAERDRPLAFMGVKDFADKVRRLPSHPEDAVIQSLRAMGIPEEDWTGYLTLHLGALPGWAGMVKWRETHPLYERQRRYPITLTEYLAVRLFYEMECVSSLCRKEWGTAGTVPALHSIFRANPGEYFARSRIAAGGLPDNIAAGVIATEDGAIALNWDAFTHPGYGDMRNAKSLSRNEQWFRFAEMLFVCSEGAGAGEHASRAVSHDAWRLFHLAQPLGLSAEEIRGLSGAEARALLDLLDDFPPEAHGPIWLQAYETHYRDRFLTLINGKKREAQNGGRGGAQVIFCLDMREEGIRRHLEARSEGYETFGTAGFFHLPMMLRLLATRVAKPSCPIPIDPRHTVLEGVRPGQGLQEARHEHRTKWKEALHSLYHRLETNLATAYSLIDLLGVPFGITVIGRTLLPSRWRVLTGTLRGRLVPSVRTSLRVDRPTNDEAEEGLAARERDLIREVVRHHGRRNPPGDGLSTEAFEELRQIILGERPAEGQARVAGLLGLSGGEAASLIQGLRENGLEPRHHAEQLAEFRMMGFAPEEQADLVEAQLRMISLTDRFARLVVFCGHGSTTENNPYAAAYHCGACGGNRGGPNARAIAAMGNAPPVRALLRRRGILIPDDTHILGAEHDTGTDRFTYFDTEDLPSTHREEFERLARDLHQAGALHAQERCRRLPRAPRLPTPEQALRHVQTRSLDWAQVYPEWGHATCAAMVIGRRALTQGLFLDRRAYLQSYDPEQDPNGVILEEIMSAFIPVVRGITLDYYFSSIDSGINGVFGAGTKAIHNVVGLIGVMQGAGGDLRPGLPAQGVVPLHEPMRAHIVIESHPAKVASILGRYRVLENLFQNQWAHLISWDPQTREFLCYRPDGTWEAVPGIPPGGRPHTGIPAPSA